MVPRGRLGRQEESWLGVYLWGWFLAQDITHAPSPFLTQHALESKQQTEMKRRYRIVWREPSRKDKARIFAGPCILCNIYYVNPSESTRSSSSLTVCIWITRTESKSCSCVCVGGCRASTAVQFCLVSKPSFSPEQNTPVMEALYEQSLKIRKHENVMTMPMIWYANKKFLLKAIKIHECTNMEKEWLLYYLWKKRI